MPPMDDPSPQRRGAPWPLLALAVLGTAHILVRTSTLGAAIGPDSVTYLSTAENLLAGHGLVDFRGHAPPQYPFLFPLLLAGVAGVTGIEAAEAARLINAAAFGTIILVAGMWLRRAIRSRALVAGATLVCATSHHLSHSASYVMTEATFIAFTLLALTWIAPFANQHQRLTRPALILAALCAGLAAATRYAGVAVIVTATLLLLARREAPLGRRLRLAAVFGALAATPLAAMVLHNLVGFGVWERPRLGAPSGTPALEVLQDAFRVMAGAVVPEQAPAWLIPVSWLAAGLLALAIAAIGVRPTLRWLAGRQTDGAMLATVIFCVTYLAFIVVALPLASVTTISNDPRYLLPLFVPLLYTASFALDRCMHLPTAGWRTVAKRTAVAVIVLGGLANAILTGREGVARSMAGLESGYFGKSYNTARWRDSEIVQHLRAHPTEGLVLSNRYGALHATLVLGSGTTERGKYLLLPLDMEGLARRLATLPEGSPIIWFADRDPRFQYDAQHLRSLTTLSLVAEFSDGLMFRVAAPGAAPLHPNV